MWKVAQKSLLQGIPRRCFVERTRCLTTRVGSATTARRGQDEGATHKSSIPAGSRKRQYPKHAKANDYGIHKNSERLFESTKEFLGKYSSKDRPWTADQLELASKAIQTWSQQVVPKELQSSWVQMVDQLMTATLHQFQMLEKTKQESQTALLPDSDAFCFLITLYSKTRLPNAAERADYWLQKMICTSESYPRRVTPPRPAVFASVLSTWEKSGLPNAPFRAEKLWMQLKSRKGLIPTSSAYYLYISLLSKSDLPEATEKAEKVLFELVHEGKRNPKLLPSCPAFVNVISSWRRRTQNDDILSAERAQVVLDLLVTEYNRRLKLPQKWTKISINDVPFNAVIQTWATSPLDTELIEERVTSILNTMEKLKVAPTMVTAWSTLPMYLPRDQQSSTLKDVPVKLLRLLDKTMTNDGGGKNPMLQNQIFAKAFEICSTYSGSVSEGAIAPAEIAEEILLNRYFKRPRGERRVETTIVGFEHAIKAWRSDNMYPVEQKKKCVVDLVRKLEKEVNHIYMHTKEKDPSSCRIYAFLAKAWAMSYYPIGALERAENSVDRLLECCKEQLEVKPSLFWFNGVVDEVKENFPEQVANNFVRKIHTKLLTNDSLFHRMMKNLESLQKENYDSNLVKQSLDGLLDALVSSGDAESGRRAETILLKQQELYEEGMCLPPTFDTFRKVLQCWSFSQEDGAPERMENMLLLAQTLYDSGDIRLRPDFDGYMTVISAWSKSQTPDAPEKIQQHLKSLHQRRLEGDQAFRIDSGVYAALILAYANSGRDDSQAMADTIFQSTPDDLKDTSLYNVLIEAQGGDANRAEALLQVMQLSFFEGDDRVKPDTESFNAVIHAWLRSGSPMAAWRVDGIFKRMGEMSETGKLDVKPNSRTFDLVISTLAQDWGAELAKVDVYLELLKDHYRAGDCVPTVTSYTEAIRAWASKNDDPRAILRAQALLDEMHELAREGVDTVRPNRSTYKAYLQGVSHSLVEDRSQLVNDVLFKMRENQIDLDYDMRSSIQRCLLPLSSRANSWVINVDDYINLQNEWIHVNGME